VAVLSSSWEAAWPAAGNILKRLKGKPKMLRVLHRQVDSRMVSSTEPARGSFFFFRSDLSRNYVEQLFCATSHKPYATFLIPTFSPRPQHAGPRYFNLSSNHLLPSIAHVFCRIKLPRSSMHACNTFNADDWPSLRFIIDGLDEHLDHSEQKAIFLLPFFRWNASRPEQHPSLIRYLYSHVPFLSHVTQPYDLIRL